MKFRGVILKFIPNWAVLLATDVRCLLRHSIICRRIPYRTTTNKSALIVAPHPDDETFSCGGLIYLKRASGVPVRVVILTDGEAVETGRGEQIETVVAARKREALQACEHLGLPADSVRWLHVPDGKIPHPGQPGFDEGAQALLAEIEAFSPEEVYCPHVHDGHSDHIASNQVTHEALRRWSRSCALSYYPVWMWYHASSGLRKRLDTNGAWRLDISAVLSDKARAAAAYLDAPKTSQGSPYVGQLPWGFLKVFRRKYEAYFPGIPEPVITAGQVSAERIYTSPQAKALFVSPAGLAYGSERSMLALLRARQFEAEVVCPGGGALEKELQQLGIKVHPTEFGKYSVRRNPFWHVGFYHRFRRVLRRVRPDVIVINLDGNTPLVTLAAVRAGIPIVRFCRFEFKPPARWLDGWCWLKAKAIICPSESVKQQVTAWAPREFHTRVHSFYDPYDGHPAAPHEVRDFRQKLGLGDDKIIGFVGRLHRGKRIETAIEALAQVRKQVGNARLLIIGGASSPDEMSYKRELQQLATDLGEGEAVIFTGLLPTEDMPAAAASFDVCVLPSESESFGMALMEAWAQGVPTVASNVGGCREITRASSGGYLVPVGDATAFADHLRRLLIDPETAIAMGQKGKTWVATNCAPAEYAAEFGSVINQTMQLRPRMKLTSKIKSLASSRAMLSSYGHWVCSKIFTGKSPHLTLPGGVRIGEWLSFSEYWSFQNIMPEPERLFLEILLANKSGERGMAFDIGANLGAFTCLISSHGHVVHSFEPVPETFCRLEKNVKFNGLLDHTFLNCVAVGKEEGVATFQIKENAPATNRMAVAGRTSANNEINTQLVAVVSLDDYCHRQGIQRIDFVKVDVEGMEPFVLQGARTLLKERKIAAILIEVCPVNLRSVGLSSADLYHEFETARYSPYALNADGRPGVRLSLAEIKAMSLANVVLLPDA